MSMPTLRDTFCEPYLLESIPSARAWRRLALTELAVIAVFMFFLALQIFG